MNIGKSEHNREGGTNETNGFDGGMRIIFSCDFDKDRIIYVHYLPLALVCKESLPWEIAGLSRFAPLSMQSRSLEYHHLA